jgi:hypothetical protein
VWRLLALDAQPDLERAHNRSHAASRIAGTMAVVLAVAALSTLGAVFGFTGSRSLWYGLLIPLYFILTFSPQNQHCNWYSNGGRSTPRLAEIETPVLTIIDEMDVLEMAEWVDPIASEPADARAAAIKDVAHYVNM